DVSSLSLHDALPIYHAYDEPNPSEMSACCHWLRARASVSRVNYQLLRSLRQFVPVVLDLLGQLLKVGSLLIELFCTVCLGSGKLDRKSTRLNSSHVT